MIILNVTKKQEFTFFRKTTGGVKLTPNLIKFTKNPFFQLAIANSLTFKNYVF